MKSCLSIFLLCLVLAFSQRPAAAQDAPKKEFFLPKSPVAAAYVLNRLSNRELIDAPRSEFVYVALLQRQGLDKKYRAEALDGLAKIRNTDRVTELLAGLVELDKKGEASEFVLRDLSSILLQAKPNDLTAKRPALEKLATASKLPLTRQIACAALITADAAAHEKDGLPLDGKEWSAAVFSGPLVREAVTTAGSNPSTLIDVLLASQLIGDQKILKAYYFQAAPLVRPETAPELRQAAIRSLSGVPSLDTEIFTLLAPLAKSPTDRAAVMTTLQRRPRKSWPPDGVASLANDLVTWLNNLPVASRTESDAVSAFQFAGDLAALLPPETGSSISKQLRDLGVNIFVVRTLPEQMLFDKTLIAVQAGKPLQIILINDDAMPHNLVVIAPDSLERVGALAEKMPPEPDGKGRLYVPNTPDILRATKLIDGGQQAKLSFTAPETPGDYQYVCTFPGHWRRMVGTLAVVKDVEAYLASHSAPKLTEWKLDDLAVDLPGAGTGRNIARGRELFTKLACATCHKLGGQGVDFGPDLSALFKQYNNDRAAILRQILEPSLVITNRYRNLQLDLKSDDTIIGMVMKEDTDSITVQSGPSDALIKSIKKSDIVAQRPSAVSPMPLGLLNTLTKDEIFDLLAWLESGGQPHAHQH